MANVSVEILEPCRQNKKACFAYKNSGCTCLIDTRFDKPCPFYKKKQAEMFK